MFSVELQFNDGVSPAELIVVRRQSFIVGSTEEADVVLEGNPGLVQSMRIERRPGRRFVSVPLDGVGATQDFEGRAEITLGDAVLKIVPLDLDLLLVEKNESTDRAGLRVLNRALSLGLTEYPAVEVSGANPCSFSFFPDQKILVGRSRSCTLRLDDPGIQTEHAKFGIDDTSQIWFEPIPGADSFIDEALRNKIEKRIKLEAGANVFLGKGGAALHFLSGESAALSRGGRKRVSTSISRYPCVVSKSELMRPERYPLFPGRKVSIGRDPSNDIWLNAVHISRLHAELAYYPDGHLEVTDLSSNGTFFNGERLNKDAPVRLPENFFQLDFSRGVAVGICFNAGDEESYLERPPAVPTGGSSLHGQILSQISIPVTPFNSDEDEDQTILSPVIGRAWDDEAKSEAPASEYQPVIGRGAGRSLLVDQTRAIQRPEKFGQLETAREDEVAEEIEQEDFAPQQRILGVGGRVLFWGAFIFLLVVNYYVYLGK